MHKAVVAWRRQELKEEEDARLGVDTTHAHSADPNEFHLFFSVGNLEMNEIILHSQKLIGNNFFSVQKSPSLNKIANLRFRHAANDLAYKW